MDIHSANQSFQDVTYGDDSFQSLLDHFNHPSDEQPYHLCLFVGKRTNEKKDALKKIADANDRKIKTVDANELISKIESVTYKSLEELFTRFSADDTILYVKNGDRLSGSYTGYTNSRVKYATPQERYFFNIVQKKGAFVIVDVDVEVDADMTLRRAAQSIVHFPKPQSGLKKFFWRLKQVSVHGHEIETKRPERYGNQAVISDIT